MILVLFNVLEMGDKFHLTAWIVIRMSTPIISVIILVRRLGMILFQVAVAVRGAANEDGIFLFATLDQIGSLGAHMSGALSIVVVLGALVLLAARQYVVEPGQLVLGEHEVEHLAHHARGQNQQWKCDCNRVD